MSNKSPIFPIAEPQHFTDYGFEPQIHYFQVLEEARKHKRETTSSRSIDLHFKLQKPISRDESSKKIKKNKKRWWRNLLPKWTLHGGDMGGRRYQHHRIGSISGPVYITESRSGSSTPYNRPGSGPLEKGDVDVPYMSLREMNFDGGYRVSAAATPIYLVT